MIGRRWFTEMGEATDTCFNCNLRGHWLKDCPSTRSQPSNPAKDPPLDGHNLPAVHCPCGGGLCAVRTSRIAKNPDRKFYSCPGGPQGVKCGFFKWCDTVGSPKSEVPFCSCGAGRCSVITETCGWNAGRRYFACRVPKGHGACPFFQWEDAQLNSTIDKDGGEIKHSDSLSTRNDQEFTCTVNVDLYDEKHANAAQSEGSSCKVSHTVFVESSRGKYDNVPQSKENDCEVTRTVNVELDKDKHTDILTSVGSCEASHAINVDSGKNNYAGSSQSEEQHCQVSDTLNVDLSGDKHADTPISAGSCEVTRTVNADSDRCKHANAPKRKESGCKVTQTVNDDLVENKYAYVSQSAGNKYETSQTVNVNIRGDKHADTPQSAGTNCEVTHIVNVNLDEDKHAKASQSRRTNCEFTRTINANLGEGKYCSSPQYTEHSHTVTVDLGFEHSKRMRSEYPMLSSGLRHPEHNLGFEHSKRMRMDLSTKGNQHHIPDSVSVSIPSAEVNLPPTESSSKQSEPSETLTPAENNSDLQSVMPTVSSPLDLAAAGIEQNSGSCISTMNKTSQGPCLSNTNISPSKLEISTQISAKRDTITGDLIVFIHETFGFHVVGWLGRLVFPPQRCVTIPPPKPFFGGIFPSFTAITVPEPMKPSDSAGSVVLPQIPHTRHEEQCVVVTYKDSILTSDHHEETSVEQQTVRSFRSNLLTLLKSMDPQDHEYMERVANPILDALDHLSADNKYFRLRVKEFILCASALSQTECHSKIEPSSKDLIDRYNKWKARDCDVTCEQDEAMDAYKASGEVCSLLREEASRLKKLLVQIEMGLSIAEMETLKLKGHVKEACKAKKECQRSLQSIKEEIKLRMRKEVELLEAKKAFKKARNKLVL